MKYQSYVLQNKSELAYFITVLKRENVKSYLEIGSKFGGSLWAVANSLPSGARVVSVDLPHGDNSFKENENHLRDCVQQLKNRGYDAHLLIGDSTKQEIVDQVYALGPFDAVFIDANHTLPYISKDWDNYGKIGKLVAFHDVGFIRDLGLDPGKKPIQVPQFWQEIKKKFKHIEIIHEPIRGAKGFQKRDNGIGVLWPR